MKKGKGPNGEIIDEEDSDDEYGDEPTRSDSRLGKRKKKGRIQLEFEDDVEPEQEAFEEVLNK
jgi:hypothetical protein